MKNKVGRPSNEELRSRRNKKLIPLFLLILIIGVGYALLSSNLGILGGLLVSGNNFDVHYTNAVVSAGSVTTTKPNISGSTSLDFDVVLEKPGDFYEFTVDVVNSGSVDAMIEGLTVEGLEDETGLLLSSITWSDGEEIKANQELKIDQKDTILVRVEYNADITADDLDAAFQSNNKKVRARFMSNNDIKVEAGVGTSYIQRDPEVAISRSEESLKNSTARLGSTFVDDWEFYYVLNTRPDYKEYYCDTINTAYNNELFMAENPMPWMPEDEQEESVRNADVLGEVVRYSHCDIEDDVINYPWYRIGEYLNNIESISAKKSFEYRNDAIINFDPSMEQNGEINAFLVDEDNNGMYELYITEDGGVKIYRDAWYLFLAFQNVKKINLSGFDFSNVESLKGMFVRLKKLEEIEYDYIDTSKVTNMQWMFSGCNNLTKIKLDFDTSNVTNMAYMFANCYSITSLDLSGFNFEKVKHTREMFYSDSNLQKIYVSQNIPVILSDGYSDRGMFNGCTSLSGKVSFDSSKVGPDMGNFENGYLTYKAAPTK